MTKYITAAAILGCISICLVAALNQTDSDKSKGTSISIEWPSDTNIISIPIGYSNDLPFIECKINGKQGKLLLDTGSQDNCFCEERLNRFGLKIESKSDLIVYTASGTRKAIFCNQFELYIGEIKLIASRAHVIPTGSWSEGHIFDGLLGTVVMKSLNAQIDFGKNLLIFQLHSQNPTSRSNRPADAVD